MEAADWLRGVWAEPKILCRSDVQQLQGNENPSDPETNIQQATVCSTSGAAGSGTASKL